MERGSPSESERLPWLEPYREPKARVAPERKPPPARKRGGSPLAVLAGLGALGLAVAGYWLGRETASDAPPPNVVTAPVPEPRARLDYPTIEEAIAEPAAPPEPEPTVADPAPRPRAQPVQRRPARTASTRPEPRESRAEPVPAPPAAPPPPKPRLVATAPPPLAGRRGEVIQLGVYATARAADAAYFRLVQRYPYLGTLPKVVAPINLGNRAVYALRIGAGSRRDARVLCKNLLSIGRGCTVV